MLSLRNFFYLLHVRKGWQGIIPATGGLPDRCAAKVMSARCVKEVLQGIADQVRTKNPNAGIKVCKEDLSLGSYSARQVARALQVLESCNVIKRQRNKDPRHGTELYATTLVNPILIDLAKAYSQFLAAKKRNKKAGQKASAQALAFQTDISLPISTWGSGKPHEIRHRAVAACQDDIQPTDTASHLLRYSLPPHHKDGGFTGTLVEVERERIKGGSDNEESWVIKRDELEAESESENNLNLIGKRFELINEARRKNFLLISDQSALPQENDRRPYITERGALGEVLFEARAFGASMELLNSNNGKVVADHTSLCLVRCGQRGRMLIFEQQTKKPGAYYSQLSQSNDLSRCGTHAFQASKKKTSNSQRGGPVDWQRVFELAYSKSEVIFRMTRSGEQIYAVPSLNSRVVMIDDLKSPYPVLDGCLCLVLETSRGNFQHLYGTDKVLTQDERQHIQVVLAKKFGGDMNATKGNQPHRVPGSVNYKPGRHQWVCRLVGNVMTVDGGNSLKTKDWLAMPLPKADQFLKDHACVSDDRIPSIQVSDKRKRLSSQTSSSEAGDWSFGISTAKKLKMAGWSGEPLKRQVLSDLVNRAREYRGSDVDRYANVTVNNLAKKGFL